LPILPSALYHREFSGFWSFHFEHDLKINN